MKVVISGSAGFIGSNLVEACLLKNWEVLGIDNFSTGDKDMANPKRVAHLPGKYSFKKLDVNNTKKLQKVISGYDVFFHLAALPRVSYSVEFPIEANNANINGTLSVLEACRLSGIKRVVFSCSSSVYGGVSKFPTSELEPAMPKSPYALHKETGAQYCRLYSELFGLETCNLLYFNVYGPYQKANSAYATVISAFCEAAVENKPCRVDGDGSVVRDFCYVDNVVQANILAAEYSGKLMGDRFNIACGEYHSVLDVYNKVKELINPNLQKYHVAPRLGDPPKSHADISKAMRVLGYVPRIKFDEGMEITAAWWCNDFLPEKENF